MHTVNYSYPMHARLLHAGMAMFGITAFLTGEFAEDGFDTVGYLLHSYLGLSLAVFVALRFLPGLLGSGPLHFAGWWPFSARQWRLALEDIRCLLRWEVPQRGMHEGLAGLTQAFGLLVFAWMGATGTAMFLLAGASHRIFEAVEEIHEVGEALIPLYLFLHVGSVVLHTMAGTPIWQRMWSFGNRAVKREAGSPT